jgi:hypothetical protein
VLKETDRRRGVVSFLDSVVGGNATGRRDLRKALDHHHQLADRVEVVQRLFPLLGGVGSGLRHPPVDRLFAKSISVVAGRSPLSTPSRS